MKKYALIMLTLTAVILSSCAPAAKMEMAAPEMMSDGMVGAAPSIASENFSMDYEMAAEEPSQQLCPKCGHGCRRTHRHQKRRTFYRSG